MFLQIMNTKIILPFEPSIPEGLSLPEIICKSRKEWWAGVSHGGGSHRFLWIHLRFMGS
jgi:hypothetical protein